MKFRCFILIFTAIGAGYITEALFKSDLFKKVHHVLQSDISFHKTSSHTGIRNRAMCVIYCIHEGCLSFSYTEFSRKCDTYSRLIVEEKDADVSNSTVYFSMDVASGVYNLATAEGKNLDVFYDMDTADGPWIVIQRRISEDVDFNRNWTDYKNGFGDLLGNFWIGNDNLHTLTRTSMILRIDLEAWNGTKGYVQYSEFKVANESQNYRLSVQGFSGSITYDAMAFHNGNYFSTYDRDNDNRPYDDCAEYYRGGWWFFICHQANLNGPIKVANGNEDSISMTWMYFPDIDQTFIPLKKCKMMIR